MLSGDALAPGPAAREEVKAYVRIGHPGEDALVDRLTASAAELCERFTGQALIARGFSETLPNGGGRCGWQRLAAAPVRTIEGVERLAADGGAIVLPVEAYRIDIDASGEGWVRGSLAGPESRLRVAYEAGLAADWASLPAALCHGIVRLAAHLYLQRDGAKDAEPPAAIAALWRPWRRLRIGR
jgi:uncharacterized phiE125 gp8 family phage protein